MLTKQQFQIRVGNEIMFHIQPSLPNPLFVPIGASLFWKDWPAPLEVNIKFDLSKQIKIHLLDVQLTVLFCWTWLAFTDRATLLSLCTLSKSAKSPPIPFKIDARATSGKPSNEANSRSVYLCVIFTMIVKRFYLRKEDHLKKDNLVAVHYLSVFLFICYRWTSCLYYFLFLVL